MKGKKPDRVRDALLKKCEEPGTNATCWPWLTGVNKVSKRQANKFMLGAIIDYQVPADQAWESARCFAEGALDDPDDLWREIVERWTETQWNSHRTWKECALHRRFPASHRRVREIGLDILRQYDGDARLIWRGQHPHEVFCRLDRLGKSGVGPQLSRMIVGALIDSGQIAGSGQFKADTHVRRLLGRVFDGGKVSESRALQIGENLFPGNSWQIDGVLYFHGKGACAHTNPDCGNCFLTPFCAYGSAGARDAHPAQ